MPASLTAEELDRVRVIADYQWGPPAGLALFEGPLAATRSRTGRIRQIHRSHPDESGDRFADPARRLVTLGRDGRFSLGLAGGKRLVDGLATPRGRVVVGDESRPFVADGKNVFAKFVRDVDPAVRPRDEVAVVHTSGAFLGVGRTELGADGMAAFETGVAVHMRSGAGEAEG